jgi:Icc-related predicted phosphoesterase
MEKKPTDLRLVCFSDPHNRYQHLFVPEGDVLICCGDIIDKTNPIQPLDQLKNFNHFLKTLPHKTKIVISGNHDEIIEKLGKIKTSEILDQCVYLENDSINIEGLTFFGSPISLTGKSNNRAFQLKRDSDELVEKLNSFHEDVDVLITHGMPFGHCDGNHGCKVLLEKVKEIKPQYHIFGHHHTSYGSSVLEHSEEISTTFINSSMLHYLYIPRNEAVVIDISKK